HEQSDRKYDTIVGSGEVQMLRVSIRNARSKAEMRGHGKRMLQIPSAF
ncbi:unnamed protein product, partial [Urochloa humidicola]